MAGVIGFDEVLSTCLDAMDGGQGVAELLSRYPEHADELKPLLEAAAWFGGQAAALEPRPGFVAASWKRLEKQIAAPPAPAASGLLQMLGGLGRGWRIALQVGVVVVMLACLVLGSSGIAYASQNALPGDALYPVKLGLEQVELLVTLDPQAAIRLHMQFSQLRLAEMERLLALGRYDDLAIASSNYRYHISRALSLLRTLAVQYPVQSRALAQELGVTLTAQADLLRVLADISPAAARAELEAAEKAAREGAQQAQEIAGSADVPLPTATPGRAQEPTATVSPTVPPTATVVSFAIATPTPTQTPSLTPTPTAPPTLTRTPTPTNTPTRTSTHTPARTATSTARPTNTPTPKSGGTAVPTATKTSRPTATRTSQPTPTRTLPPTPTRTGQPTPTRTMQPTPTRTGQPTPTRTLQPTATLTGQPTPIATIPATPTRTPQPSPTATDIPTSTIAPTATRTPRPTNTPRPTDSPEPSPYPGPGAYPPPD